MTSLIRKQSCKPSKSQWTKMACNEIIKYKTLVGIDEVFFHHNLQRVGFSDYLAQRHGNQINGFGLKYAVHEHTG